MNNYIATFYSHYGALVFYKGLCDNSISAEMIPVPRILSASCGICVSFSHDSWGCAKGVCELESVYQEEGDGAYTHLYDPPVE